MEYHSKTLRLINQSVGIGSTHEFAAAEESLGVSLPESVREWYTKVDGREILAKYSNDDHALPPSEFRLEIVENRRLVLIMNENQS